MFGLFAPRCPLNLGLKVWTERRFRDIGEELGASHIRQVEVVEPGSELLQAAVNSDDATTLIFEQVCRWMDVSSSSLRLNVMSSDEMAELAASQGASGAAMSLYGIPAVDGEAAQLIVSADLNLDADQLLAMIARGVAHDVLRTRLPDLFAARDQMRIIDLVPVFFGLGIFVANSTVRDLNGVSGAPTRADSLSSEVYGYALALAAWVRGEGMADWTRHLRLDARETMKSGFKFLAKSGDCVFDADSFGHRTQPESLAELRRALDDSSPSLQMNALLNLMPHPDDCRQLCDELIPQLKMRDRDQRAQAVLTISACTTQSEDALRAVIGLCDDSETTVRLSVATTLKPGSVDDESSIHTLTGMLADRDPGVCIQAASSLLEFDSLPDELLRPALELLRQGNIRCAEPMMQVALLLLARVCDDVPALLSTELDEESQAMIADLTREVLGAEVSAKIE
ncbi:MAG: HEAT repeat domain-containing protein [Planctomycetota bacterium]|nr:HEAT repeat domain-containing protein [Planctomycetota bacterium]MDA1251345.1 HEAT repeat domain-containing protein [Planctomycetota bacterium]